MFTDIARKLIKPRQKVDGKVLSSAAAALMDNPAYQQAREEILRGIVEQWLGSAPNASDKRESLYHEANALMRAESQLKVAMAQVMMKDRVYGQPE